ncbi:MAG: DHH family phosphoesterase, partial [Chloroflexota bacterium]
YMSQEILRESGGTSDDAEGIAENLRGIEQAEVVMLLKESPDGDIRVSMRSRPAYDVAAIAFALGGGGHRQAAGVTLPGPAAAAKEKLLAAFDRLTADQRNPVGR